MPTQPMTDQAFMIRSELSIKEGRLDDFVRINGAIVEAVREVEPAMISFIQFMNEDRTRGTWNPVAPLGCIIRVPPENDGREDPDRERLDRPETRRNIYGPTNTAI